MSVSSNVYTSPVMRHPRINIEIGPETLSQEQNIKLCAGSENVISAGIFSPGCVGQGLGGGGGREGVTVCLEKCKGHVLEF